MRYSYSEVDFLQASVSGPNFAEFRIELDDVDVYLGQDDSRQANDLDWEVEQLVARGTYALDDHTITFGYERDSSVLSRFLRVRILRRSHRRPARVAWAL